MRVLVTALLVLSGCGDGGGGGSTAPAEDTGGKIAEKDDSYTKLIAKGEDVPECGEDNASQLIYVVEDEEFQVCRKGAWKAVDLKKGEPGKPGAAGEPGKDGEDGESAPAPQIVVKQWTCEESDEIGAVLSVVGTGVYVTELYDGGYQISCMAKVSDGEDSISYYHTDMWAPDTAAVKDDGIVRCQILSTLSADFRIETADVLYTKTLAPNNESVKPCTQIYPTAP